MHVAMTAVPQIMVGTSSSLIPASVISLANSGFTSEAAVTRIKTMVATLRITLSASRPKHARSKLGTFLLWKIACEVVWDVQRSYHSYMTPAKRRIDAMTMSMPWPMRSQPEPMPPQTRQRTPTMSPRTAMILHPTSREQQPQQNDEERQLMLAVLSVFENVAFERPCCVPASCSEVQKMPQRVVWILLK